MTGTTLRLATRGSKLALAQTDIAISALKAAGVQQTETVIVASTGDKNQTTAFTALPGVGWFTTSLQVELVEGRVDAAVHSAKDLPSITYPELKKLFVAAYLERGDVRDVAITRDGATLNQLPPGSRVGTSSPRRVGLLRAHFPQLEPVPIRGNVDSRLAKLDGNEVDALILAGVGLQRIGLESRVAQWLDPTKWVPAPAQASVAIEAVHGSSAFELCGRANHKQTADAIEIERSILANMGGGCQVGLGAWVHFEGDEVVLSAALATTGEPMRLIERRAPRDKAAEFAKDIAKELKEA